MKHISTTVEKLMAAARRSRYYKQELPFFEDVPDKERFLDDVKQFNVHKDFFTSTRQLRLHEKANYYGTNPLLMGFGGKLCLKLRKLSMPVYVHSAYRSHELQEQLFKAGLTKLKDGPHQRGSAIDIVHSLYHWRLTENMWHYIGMIGKDIIKREGLPILWGGDFKSTFDPSHWELKNWRNQPTVLIPSSRAGSELFNVSHTPHGLIYKYGKVRTC